LVITVTLNTTVDKTLHIDDFQIDKVNLGRLVSLVPSGKGVNLGNVLYQLGLDAIVTGFVGQSEHHLYSKYYNKSRNEKGDNKITLKERLVEVNGITRFNTTVIDPTNRTETHMRELGFEVTDEYKERLTKRLMELSTVDDLIFFSGSLPQNYSVDDFADLLKMLLGEGRKIIVDTSLDALKKAAALKPFMIKPNRQEIEYLFGKSTGSLEELARLSRDFLDAIGMILISLGKDGGMFINKESSLYAYHNLGQERVANTVGCGDSFHAGFIYMYLNGKSFSDCLKFAVACGSSSATIPNAGMINVEKAYKFFDEVCVREIE